MGRVRRTDQMHIDVDSSGNIYVTGQTNSTNFVTANPYQATSGGFKDVFVTKLSATSALQYSTYLVHDGVDNSTVRSMRFSADPADNCAKAHTTNCPPICAALY